MRCRFAAPYAQGRIRLTSSEKVQWLLGPIKWARVELSGRPEITCPIDHRPEAVVSRRHPRGGVELERSRFLPGTDRGFSVDDEFQAHPMSCESLAITPATKKVTYQPEARAR